ncbi:MAG: hypothetical protein LBV33_06075 [Lachnospiraceae bacterium]|nr:hypothetical protein [Lachnospiraceae bacterium]
MEGKGHDRTGKRHMWTDEEIERALLREKVPLQIMKEGDLIKCSCGRLKKRIWIKDNTDTVPEGLWPFDPPSEAGNNGADGSSNDGLDNDGGTGNASPWYNIPKLTEGQVQPAPEPEEHKWSRIINGQEWRFDPDETAAFMAGRRVITETDIPIEIRRGTPGFFGQCSSVMTGEMCEPKLLKPEWFSAYDGTQVDGKKVVLHYQSFLYCLHGGIIGSEAAERPLRSVFSDDEIQAAIIRFLEDANEYVQAGFEYMWMGDYSKKFNLLGLVLSVGVGMTPVAGQAADARDLVYAVSHTEDHSLLTNVAIIAISVIAFVPFFGDLIKQLKQLKHVDEVAELLEMGAKAGINVGQYEDEAIAAMKEALERSGGTVDEVVEGGVKEFGVGRGIGRIPQEIIENGKNITEFANPHDPIRDILGRGKDSHPEEWNSIVMELENSGVEIIYRQNVMGYSPHPSNNGLPGQLLIDPDASISALEHEYIHFTQASEAGFPNMQGAFQDTTTRITNELSSYEVEIKYARELGLDNVVEQLTENLEVEINTINAPLEWPD